MKRERTHSFLSGVFTGIFSILLLASLIGTAIATTGKVQREIEYRDISVILDGQKLELTDAKGNKVEPFMIDGTNYLPVRALAESLGLSVSWDGKNSAIILKSADSSQNIDSLKNYPNSKIPMFENVVQAAYSENYAQNNATVYKYALSSLPPVDEADPNNYMASYVYLLVGANLTPESGNGACLGTFKDGNSNTGAALYIDGNYFYVVVGNIAVNPIPASNIQPITSAKELDDYLTSNYKTISTQVGKAEFNYSVYENTQELFPYDYEINIIMDRNFFNLFDGSIVYSKEQQAAAKDQLRSFTKQIANDILPRLDGKKVQCSFTYSYYEYPTLEVGFHIYRMLTWVNFSPADTTYYNAKISDFSWYEGLDLLSWRSK